MTFETCLTSSTAGTGVTAFKRTTAAYSTWKRTRFSRRRHCQTGIWPACSISLDVLRIQTAENLDFSELTTEISLFSNSVASTKGCLNSAPDMPSNPCRWCGQQPQDSTKSLWFMRRTYLPKAMRPQRSRMPPARSILLLTKESAVALAATTLLIILLITSFRRPWAQDALKSIANFKARLRRRRKFLSPRRMANAQHCKQNLRSCKVPSTIGFSG